MAERERYAGWWIALELYTPQTLPLRLIEALGPSSAECMEQLQHRQLSPARFEYVRLESA